MNGSKLLNPASVAAIVILGVAAIGLAASIRSFDLYLQKLPIYPQSGMQFHNLPAELETWTRLGEDQVMSAEAADELGTTNYLSRQYVQTDAPPGEEPHRILLHCAYYTGMLDTVPHVPERCLVGNGWDIAGRSKLVPVDLSFEDERGYPRIVPDPDIDAEEHGTIYTMRSPITRTRVRMPRNLENLSLNVTRFRNEARDAYMHAGYFFLANGGVVATADDVRLLAFKLNDDYAYYAKIQFTSLTVDSAEELGEVAGDLLDELMPEIMRCVPDWIEVQEGRYPPDNPRRKKQEM